MGFIARNMAIGRSEWVFTLYSVLYVGCFGAGLWLGFSHNGPYAFLALSLAPPALLALYLIVFKPFSILPSVLEEYDPHIFKLLTMQSDRTHMGGREFKDLVNMRIRDAKRSELSPMMHRFLERRRMAWKAVFAPVVISLSMFALMLVIQTKSL